MSAIAEEKPDGSLAPMLVFLPTSCAIELNEHPGNVGAPSIGMRLKLSNRETVRTPNEKSLNDIEWSISVHRGPVSNDYVRAQGAIGALNYYRASEGIDHSIPEGCCIWAHVQPESFDILSTLALSRRLPSSIRVHAGGLSYGWEPDGSAKVWDVEASKNALVKQLDISIGVHEGVEPDNIVDQERRPPNASDLRSLEQNALTAFANQMRQLGIRLGWMLAAIVAILAFEAFRAV